MTRVSIPIHHLSPRRSARVATPTLLLALALMALMALFALDVGVGGGAGVYARPNWLSSSGADGELLDPNRSRFARNCAKWKQSDRLPVCKGFSSRNPNCRLEAANGPVLRKFQIRIDQGPLTTTGLNPPDARDFIRVNGQSPAPAIEVNVGDVVDVTVSNRLSTETVIHWHGMLQTGTTFADGVPGLSQCPIPAGGKFSYRFVAEIPGTFWYHGHIHDQYTDGLRGPLIIHRPKAQDTRKRRVDATFLIAEYVPLFSPTLTRVGHCPISSMNGGSPVIVTAAAGLTVLLTNGTTLFIPQGGVNPCGGGGATRTEVNGDVNETRPLLVDYTGLMDDLLDVDADADADTPAAVVAPFLSDVNLKASSTNGRLRFINGASRTPFQVFIDGHDALLTEIDGVLSSPKAFPNFHLHVAQRVVLEFDPFDTASVTNQTIRDQGFAQFYITVGNAATGITTRGNACNQNPAVGQQGCLTVRTGYIVFSAKGAATVRARLQNGTAVASPPLTAAAAAQKLLRNGRTRGRLASDITEANNLDTVPLEQTHFLTESDVTHIIELTVVNLGGLFGFNNKLYSETRQYTNAPYALAGYAETKFGDSEKVYAPWGGNASDVFVPDHNLTFSTPYGAVVEIRLTGASGHPIHLHGHVFNVIAANNTQTKRDVAVGGTTLAGEPLVTGAPQPKLVIRFRNDNPGVWAIHCHIDWHMDMGLFALIMEASDKLKRSGIPIPTDNFKSCRAFPECDSTHMCPELDDDFERGRQSSLRDMLNRNILDMDGTG